MGLIQLLKSIPLILIKNSYFLGSHGRTVTEQF